MARASYVSARVITHFENGNVRRALGSAELRVISRREGDTTSILDCRGRWCSSPARRVASLPDIALGFAEEGAQVAICARTKADLDAKAKEIAQATGEKVIGIPVDLSQRGEPERLVGEVVKALGRLGHPRPEDGAGVAPGRAVEQLSDDDWDRGIQLKLMGLVRCTRAAIPVMRRQGGGRIVNVVGNDGVKCAYWEIVPAICCAAEQIFTATLAEQYGAEGTNVNSAEPGPGGDGPHARPLRTHRPEPRAQCRRGCEGPCGQHPAQARAGRRETREVTNVVLLPRLGTV